MDNLPITDIEIWKRRNYKNKEYGWYDYPIQKNEFADEFFYLDETLVSKHYYLINGMLEGIQILTRYE